MRFLGAAAAAESRSDTDHAAAWESLARTLFRLNEFVYLD
jgi:hypothetical protein